MIQSIVFQSPTERARHRVAVEHVTPEIDAGRFAIKRVAGDIVVVEADAFADGHDLLTCLLLSRREEAASWNEAPMAPLGNDRWRATFTVPGIGRYRYTIEAWIDPFRTWRHDFTRRVEAGQDVTVDLQIGADLVDRAAACAPRDDAAALTAWGAMLRAPGDLARRAVAALDEALAALAYRWADRRFATRYAHELAVVVDRPRARFSSWYELFPRSCSPEPGRHGTLRDCEATLPRLAAMGFDVLYLPPIHPIGRRARKGRNNTEIAGPGDVGSPWAIGAAEGGHTAVHPALGTLEDFQHLVSAAADRGIEVALDIAFQCAPDHPWVTEHPTWFRARPDGTIQYAENPPKKYQDIYPFDFETEDWRALWDALTHVMLFWVDQGVRIFRVDNPHTKAFPFWEHAIATIKARHPDVLFLAEAFTRPRVMEWLAKIGFSQSYTYFTWRNTSRELREYFTALTTTEVVEYLRPHLWPNTPDILSAYLQTGGPAAFAVRAVLAATLGAGYGIYGPAFERAERVPREPGSEEYLESEKYEIRQRDLDAPGGLSGLLTTLNRIRRAHTALQDDRGLRFHDVDNEALLCYSKVSMDRSSLVLMVVNLDPAAAQAGWVTLDLASLGLDPDAPYPVRDELSDRVFTWNGARNFVQLTPGEQPAHILVLPPPGAPRETPA
jgi:starch synthase (maltosyl-transferring)